MRNPTRTRRDVLKTTAAAAVMGSLAGCGSGGGGGGTDGGGTPTPQRPTGSASPSERDSLVPAKANALFYWDFKEFRTDEQLKRLFDTGVKSGTGADSLEGALQEAGLESIDPEKIYDMMIFSEISEDNPLAGSTSYSGGIFYTGIASSKLVPALKQLPDAQISEETYNGQTILVSQSGEEGVIGVVSDGIYAFGPRAVVEDVIDVEAGNADSVSGRVIQELESTKESPFRFAMDLPTGTFEGDSGGQLGQVQYTSEIDLMSGSLFYTTGDQVGFQINLTMSSEQIAREGEAFLKQIKSSYMQRGDEQVKQQLEKLSIMRSGKTVSVSYENTVDNLIQLSQGGGATGYVPVNPVVN